MHTATDAAQQLRDLCDRLNCDFDTFYSVLSEDPLKFTSVIARFVSQTQDTHNAALAKGESGTVAVLVASNPREMAQNVPTGQPLTESDSGHCKSFSRAIVGEPDFAVNGNVDSLPSQNLIMDKSLPHALVRETAKADGILPTEQEIGGKVCMDPQVATRSLKRKRDSMGKRTGPTIAKMMNIASPSTIVRLWSSCRDSRTGTRTLTEGHRQVLPVEPELSMDGKSVLDRLDILKEQSAVASSNMHFFSATKRFHHVQMVHLYHKAKSLDQSTANATNYDPKDTAPHPSLVDQFAEKLFPSKAGIAMRSGSNISSRQPLKNAFNTWLTVGKKLAMLVTSKEYQDSDGLVATPRGMGDSTRTTASLRKVRF
ncbi:hypothetical protein CH63R_10598 [Colletotrichum higginsianum IMI 349063]|uniref:Uncharacterized protein n=1 Tax=Colletotrichum higginsianum (strain IMI 349063) TaxID=759273 RepID=A0A1B7Y3A2_COLHI|nr:uncharacterized protein CH63R_10598 [Colletotrichum higginsianum IMI 349063]OBR06478.1 hypothetical protein CH63R_10598 [Colletotrichum higginsianum IMI 349063]